MKLFISWSGPVSQQIAQEVRDWFPLILPAVEPFITTTDIDKGARWQGEISRELDASNYGIVCLTADNIKSQWLTFEAGALSKHLSGRVATLLFGVGHNDIHPPLSMFQGTLFNEADVRQLVLNVNAAVPVELRRDDAQLNVLFPMLWPRLEEPVRLILQNAAQVPAANAAAPDYSSLALEMMALLRQQSAVLSSPEKFLAPVLSILEQRLSPKSSLELDHLRPNEKIVRAILAKSAVNKRLQSGTKFYVSDDGNVVELTESSGGEDAGAAGNPDGEK